VIKIRGDINITFDPFSLDLANECLRRGEEVIKLRPKAFAVINYLIGRPGQLVTKQELLNTVWPETFVGDAVLKVAIRQLREALGDNPRSPRFIETAHRRGYRFIGQISRSEQLRTREPAIGRQKPVFSSTLLNADSTQSVVGREEALRQMEVWLEKVLGGERQIVFVTGEAGIGKTALVDTFARTVAANRSSHVAAGQCLEQYGTGEAFLPVLDAIGRLCREKPQVVDVLRAYAPMWLLQMPSLTTAADRESLSREVFGATRERMLREMGQTLEALTEQEPLVLILEDLHWSDYSTLDLISYLARQRQPTQLMLIGTYRPVELIVSGHPLKGVKQELLGKQQCEELPLEYLSEHAIAEYLSTKFPTNRFPIKLSELIHERTEGNPLFMVNAVDYLAAKGLISESQEGWTVVEDIEKVEVGVPDSIKQMIEKQVEHLDLDEQRTLEAASAVGAEFSSLAVAAGLAEEQAVIERRCDELARQRHFIQDCGVQILPNGEAVTRYGFIHALYQNVLYERAPVSKRIQLHRQIGERGAEVYGERSSEIAGELAMHFERGANPKLAAKYLQQAADNAIRRFAYREAVEIARHGIELLEKVPANPERINQELCLHLTLGVPLIATEGYAAPVVGDIYSKARELYQQIADTPDVSEVLWGLWTFHMLKAELDTAREIAEEILQTSERLPYPGLAMRGHWALEITFTHLGYFALTLEHYDKALALYDPKRHLDDSFLYALNPGVAMPCFAAWALWFLGKPDQALRYIQDAVAFARQLLEPHGLAHALFFATVLYQLRRDHRMAREHAEAAMAVSTEHGLVMYEAMATIMRGWALMGAGLKEEAVEQIRHGLAALQATGTELVRPHFLGLLSETLGSAGKCTEGLLLIDEAIMVAQRTDERYYEAELYRLKGELLIMQLTLNDDDSAKSEHAAFEDAYQCFRESIRIAQQQSAKSWELRAVMSLAKLLIKQGKAEEAQRMVREVYGCFTEGFETPDLIEASKILELQHHNGAQSSKSWPSGSVK
jgi:DNA-binding winged helix-turn-helix (wHTH) protein/predicted ATPase